MEGIIQGNRSSEIIECARYFQENPHFKEDLEDRLKRADLGIEAFEILNHLAKEQIVLVQKNDECVSSLCRLCEVKGVKREENFFANYNAGRYEAVPGPSLF